MFFKEKYKQVAKHLLVWGLIAQLLCQPFAPFLQSLGAGTALAQSVTQAPTNSPTPVKSITPSAQVSQTPTVTPVPSNSISPTRSPQASGIITYTYDAAGSMTSDGSRCYLYNDASQLTTIKDCATGKLIAQYVYDFAGNRIKKSEFTDGALKQTTYTPHQAYETKKSAADNSIQNTSYYYVNNRLEAQKNPDGTKTYYLADNLGSTTTLVDQNKNVVESTSYFPFGEVRSGGTKGKYLFTGKEKEPTGLTYFGARYYNSAIGRFTQADTEIPNLYDPQQLNRYSYVANNPFTHRDPNGHCIEDLCVAELGLAGTALLGIASHPEIISEEATAIDEEVVQIGTEGVNALSEVANRAGDATKQFVEQAESAPAKLVENVHQVVKNGVTGDQGETASKILKTYERIESATGTAKYRIPDSLIRENGVVKALTEVKNVQNLRITNQLRDFSIFSAQNNIRPQLIIDVNTNISEYAQNMLDEMNFGVIRMQLR